MLHSHTARFSHRPYHFSMSVYFSTICHMTSRKLRLPQCIMGDDLHIWSYLVQNEMGGRNTCSFRSPWVTLALNLFFPTHFVLFPSALIWAVDGTVFLVWYPWPLGFFCLISGSGNGWIHVFNGGRHSVQIFPSRQRKWCTALNEGVS